MALRAAWASVPWGTRARSPDGKERCALARIVPAVVSAKPLACACAGSRCGRLCVLVTCSTRVYRGTEGDISRVVLRSLELSRALCLLCEREGERVAGPVLRTRQGDTCRGGGVRSSQRFQAVSSAAIPVLARGSLPLAPGRCSMTGLPLATWRRNGHFIPSANSPGKPPHLVVRAEQNAAAVDAASGRGRVRPEHSGCSQVHPADARARFRTEDG